MGDAQDAIAPRLQLRIAGPIALEGGATAVEAETVGFDDHPSSRPQEVDLIRAHARVHHRLGKAVAAAEAEEGSLELTAGQVGVGAEGLESHQAEVEGAAGCSLVEIAAETGMQVGQGSGGSGHSNTGIEGGATGAEGAGPVHQQALAFAAAGLAGNRDVDQTGRARQDAPQLCGAAVAEDCALS